MIWGATYKRVPQVRHFSGSLCSLDERERCFQQVESNQSYRTKKIDLSRSFYFCDPKGIQFEPLLAHFEQLRQMYEMMEKEENDV